MTGGHITNVVLVVINRMNISSSCSVHNYCTSWLIGSGTTRVVLIVGWPLISVVVVVGIKLTTVVTDL